jgi:antagonist of KipI
MDPFAHRLANLLVHNPDSAATLEVTMVGPEVLFDDERAAAVAGAEFQLTVSGRGVPHGEPFVIPRGGILRFGERVNGARAYLAIGGGIDVPPVLGSRSTHVPGRFGGLGGRALVAGDYLPLGPVRPAGALLHAPSRERGEGGAPHDRIVRVVAGPHEDRFMADALQQLQSAPYLIQADSDRMGFRLAGPGLRHTRGADIISDATPLGTLQVPASGQPVLLMADRQTTGGYVQLATVIAADIGVAAQGAPGDSISFRVCTRHDALTALIARERRLLALGSHRS